MQGSPYGITTRSTAAVAGLVAVSAGFAAVAVLYAVDPVQGWFYPRCPLLALTGLYCPGCGTLRSLHALLHGDFAASFGHNPLLWLATPFAIGASLRHGLALTGLRPRPRPLPATAIWTIFAIIVVYSMARNIPLSPFQSLVP